MRKKLLVTPSSQDWASMCVLARCLGVVLVKKGETVWLTVGPASKSGNVCLLCMVLLAVDICICFSPDSKPLSLSFTLCVQVDLGVLLSSFSCHFTLPIALYPLRGLISLMDSKLFQKFLFRLGPSNVPLCPLISLFL